MATKKPIKSFSRLTKSEKRIAIAKDVLAQIKLKTFVAKEGVYLNVNFKNSIKFKEQDKLETCQLNTLIQDNKVTCQVCALGSVFTSHVNKTNHLKYNEVYLNEDQPEMQDRLKNIFSINQLNLIECAFEKRVISDDGDYIEKWDGIRYVMTEIGQKAVKFGKSHRGNTKRLVAIMENIIKNKGEFKP